MRVSAILALVASAASVLALPHKTHKNNLVAAPAAVALPSSVPAIVSPPPVLAQQQVVTQVIPPKPNVDLNVLNFALTLEHLEGKFYEIGLTKFSEQAFAEAGFKPFVRKEFVNINNHEAVHVDFLTQTINSVFGVNMAVPECEYNFDVALANVKNFVTFASILERTGVSAYDGANHLLTNPDFLTAAATIATTEGRHAAFLNLITGNSPATGDFDIPLGIQPIISLAAPLIKSCPFDLPAKPFPALSVAAQDNVVALNGNVVVLFEMNGIASPYRATDLDTTRVGQENRRPSEVGLGQYSNLMCNFVFGLQQERTEVVAVSVRVNGQEVMVPSCNVPNVLQNFSQVVLFITNADTDVSLDNPNNVVAGPAILQIVKQ